MSNPRSAHLQLTAGARVIDSSRMKVAVVTAPADKGGWYTLTGAYVEASWQARGWTLVPLPPLRDEGKSPTA
ncbi:hypothetical protein [Streptomyces sp. TRM64462]|uniref:hypothetical protein n=1 Tax=Streptomyces sp. TRM64462 TaxID=2741726 RepID=UPI001585F694|nr:hypothetical protein [Streptomyces sp. TRM64462]